MGSVTAFCTVYSVFDVSLVGYPFHFTVFAYLVKGRVHEVYFFELIVFASVPYVLRESVHIFYFVCVTVFDPVYKLDAFLFLLRLQFSL